VDNCCYIDNFVAAGADNQLYAGRVYSHHIGHCHYSLDNRFHSGTKNIEAIWIFPKDGEAFGNILQSNLQGGVTVMKKRNTVVCFLMILALIASFAACAATRTQESTGEYVDDSVITTKVKSLLAADDFLKSFQIGVETFKGVVQLSGFVNSQEAVDKAVKITRSVKWVKEVKNDLVIK
jgi:BON domain